MSRVGFHCPDNPLLWRTLSDCERCDNPCLSIEIVRLVWDVEFVQNANHYHNDPRAVSVTETMGCLREAFYNKTKHYVETPESMLARVQGTVFHAAAEKANDDGHSEVELSADLGDGYSLKGTADRLTDDAVIDYKTMNSPRKTYDEANAVQLSIYDEMAGGDPRRLLVYQVGRKGVAVHEVHRVEGALDEAKRRANVLVACLSENEPPVPEGREMKLKFTGKPICNWCPHKETCEAETKQGEKNE